jgi:hypothetical protein
VSNASCASTSEQPALGRGRALERSLGLQAAALDESVQESVEEGLEDMIADAGSGNAEMAVHVVTEEEAAAGMYSVHEVLLPLPTGGDP